MFTGNRESNEELRVQSMGASHWLTCESLSSAELSPDNKGQLFSFRLSSTILIEYESFPFWPPDAILIEVSVY